jgi:hypothetical protein
MPPRSWSQELQSDAYSSDFLIAMKVSPQLNSGDTATTPKRLRARLRTRVSITRFTTRGQSHSSQPQGRRAP